MSAETNDRVSDAAEDDDGETDEDDPGQVKWRAMVANELNTYCLEPRDGDWMEWNERYFRGHGSTWFILKFIKEHDRVRMLRRGRDGNYTIIMCKNCVRLIDMYFGENTKETVFADEETNKLVYMGSDSELESNSETEIYI